MLTIYGPAHHDQYASFIPELSRKCMFACLPLVIGGDFNLIWTSNDKDNSNVNPGLMNMFNIFIDLHQLQEIRRSGSKYTWTNKQASKPGNEKLGHNSCVHQMGTQVSLMFCMEQEQSGL
jgi:hypothetical protein